LHLGIIAPPRRLSRRLGGLHPFLIPGRIISPARRVWVPPPSPPLGTSSTDSGSESSSDLESSSPSRSSGSAVPGTSSLSTS